MQPPSVPPRDRSRWPAGNPARSLRDRLPLTRPDHYTPRHLVEGTARRQRQGLARHRAAGRWQPRLPAATPGTRRPPATGSAPWRHRRAPAAAAGLLMLFGLTPAVGGVDATPPPDPAVQVSEAAVRALTDREQASDTPSRSLPREPADLALPTAPPPPPESPEPETSATPTATPADEPEQAPLPAPIGWLDERQMEHAATIVRVGQEMGLPEQAYVVALATAMQESTLRVLANPAYPESYDLPHDGEGRDHDSVGLFQQRPVSGWGTVEECMDPEHSARSFYEALRRVSGWERMPVTVAAQTVQVSAFPGHYAKHEGLARKLVDALT